MTATARLSAALYRYDHQLPEGTEEIDLLASIALAARGVVRELDVTPPAVAQNIWQTYAVETGRSLPVGLADKLADAAMVALRQGDTDGL